METIYQGGLVDPGVGDANLDPRMLTRVPGYTNLRRSRTREHAIQVAECAHLWAQFRESKIHPYLMLEALKPHPDPDLFGKLNRLAPHIFSEAMTRSDFANLTTYVLDRLLLDNYAKYPKTWEGVAKIHNRVKDFRTIERWQVDGGERVYQKVGEMAGFNRQSMKSGKYTYSVYKYEMGDQISWEATVNDDMDMFGDVAERLSTGGGRTIEQLWLSLICSAAGPNSTFYGDAVSLVNGGTIANIINLSGVATGTFTGVKNPKLDVLNVILASGLFMNQMTAEGRPINIATDTLTIAVADGILYQTLLQIINTNQIATTVLGGTKASSSVTSDLMLQSKNWIAGRIKPVFIPEARNIVTSNGASSWWMFAQPGSGRPAIELGFLDGWGEPQLFRKLPNTVRVGGGGTVDELGDFETMGTELKGVLVFGGTRMDPRMTMASNGTGS